MRNAKSGEMRYLFRVSNKDTRVTFMTVNAHFPKKEGRTRFATVSPRMTMEITFPGQQQKHYINVHECYSSVFIADSEQILSLLMTLT